MYNFMSVSFSEFHTLSSSAKILKMVKIRQTYGEFKGVNLFLRHSVVHSVVDRF